MQKVVGSNPISRLPRTHSPRRQGCPGRFLFRDASLGLLSPGALAEWLRSGLQSRLHRFDSGRRLSCLQMGVCCGGNGLFTVSVTKRAPTAFGAGNQILPDERVCIASLGAQTTSPNPPRLASWAVRSFRLAWTDDLV